MDPTTVAATMATVAIFINRDMFHSRQQAATSSPDGSKTPVIARLFHNQANALETGRRLSASFSLIRKSSMTMPMALEDGGDHGPRLALKQATRRQPLHAKTAEALGRRIVGGALQPGAVLPNADVLAREYCVSRPALREAIKLLAGKGLLEMAPRRGTVVRPRASWNRLDDDVISWELGEAPNTTFVRNLFELRRMIEPEAAALAAVRASRDGIRAIEAALSAMTTADFDSRDSILADLEFHRAILTHSGNDFLATFAPAIEAYLQVTFDMQRHAEYGAMDYLREHAAVFHAIRDRQPDRARAATLALLRPAEGDALAGLGGLGTNFGRAHALVAGRTSGAE